MFQRSDPNLLLFEGALLKVTKVVSSAPCGAISIKAIDVDNTLRELGTLEEGIISVPSGLKIFILWYEYDSDLTDEYMINSIDLLFDGSYSI